MPRSLSAVLLALASFVMVACASSDPSVSGIGLFDRRNVFVGDTVTISLPADPEAGDGWRLVQFDSQFLRPMAGSGEFKGSSLTFRFRAAVPGEARLVFQRIRNQRTTDERRSFNVIVRDRL